MECAPDHVVEACRAALLRLVETIAALVVAPPLARAVWRRALRLLGPAEAATRRLLVVLAAGLAVPRPAAPPLGALPRRPLSSGRRAAFALADRLKPWSRPSGAVGMPRLSVPGLTEPAPLPPRPDPAGGAALSRRLSALRAILDDLPRAARLMARFQARQRARLDEAARSPVPARRFARLSPLRPGNPPCHRRRRDHAIDDLLADWHLRAMAVLAAQRPAPS